MPTYEVKNESFSQRPFAFSNAPIAASDPIADNAKYASNLTSDEASSFAIFPNHPIAGRVPECPKHPATALRMSLGYLSLLASPIA